jgi:S-adenosylmethionine hydrolase
VQLSTAATCSAQQRPHFGMAHRSASELGVALDPAGLTRLDNPALSVRAGVIDAEVLWVDAFGNVQLSALGRHAAAAGFGDRVEVRTRAAKTSTGPVSARRIIAFAELGEGELGIIVDSNGHLALVGDRSSAALALGLAAQDQVTLLGVP